MTYRLSPRAEADIEAIGDYIGERSPTAAVQLTKAFIRRWELLATQPYSGARRDDILVGIRHLVIGEYLTLYRVTGADIEIVRVLHGRRDITADELNSDPDER